MNTNKELIIKIDNINSRIYGLVDRETITLIDDALKFRRKGIEHSEKVRSGKWDGYTKCFNRRFNQFPTGLISWVIDILKHRNIDFKVEDMRTVARKNRKWHIVMPDGMDFYDFQKETIDIATKATRGIFAIATGGGKTLTFTGIIAKLSIAPTVVYVPSLLLLEQTKEEIERFLKESGKDIEVGIVGNGLCDIKDITVMTVQTAITACGYSYNKNGYLVKKSAKFNKKKRKNYENPDKSEDLSFIQSNKLKILKLIKNAKVVICDECHRSSSSTYQTVLKESKSAYYRLAFSATAFREDNTEKLMHGVFGRKLVDVRCSDLIKRDVLVKPYIYAIPAPIVKGKFYTYGEARKQCIIKNANRNKLIAKIANELKQYGPTLILVQQISHGKELHKLLKDTSIFISGSDTKKKKDEAISDLLDGTLPQLIATPIADEGLNLKPLRSLILCDPGKSATKLYQRVGRTLRINEGKENAIIIDFIDDERVLNSHYRQRKKLYLQEEEFVLIEVDGNSYSAVQKAVKKRR